jgi:hypothetical protein
MVGIRSTLFCLAADGFFLGVDVLGRDLARRVLVLLDPLLVPRELRLLGEDLHLHGGVELGDDVAALIRQAELLVRGQVPALVLPIRCS